MNLETLTRQFASEIDFGLAAQLSAQQIAERLVRMIQDAMQEAKSDG